MKIKNKGISKILLLFFLGLSNFVLKAQLIDYDVERLNYTGNEGQRLQQVINAASDFDTIEFKSPSYDFENNGFTLNKPLELKGILGPGWNANHQGAIAVGTQFVNTRRIDIRSSDVTLRNLDIQIAENSSIIVIDARHPNFISGTGDLGAFFSNFNMSNCFVRGAVNSSTAFNIFAGNGFEGTISQVTFEGFTFAAINFDRKGRVNTFPKVIIDNCSFAAKEPVGFNDWAVSFDAGNEDYPFVWDGNDTEIKNSVFINTGIALSKIQNITIADNTFNHTKDFNIQQIHIEEYSRNITATGNTFNCNTPGGITQVFGLDREHQTLDNIKLNGNFINGKFSLAVTSYSITNFEFKNNTFGSNAESTSTFPLSFTFSASIFLGQDPGHLPSSNIDISGNIGLTNLDIVGVNGKIVDIFLENGIGGLTTDLADNFIRKRDGGTGPEAAIPDGIYFIDNVNGRIQDSGKHPRIAEGTLTGDFVKWAVERVTPYTYSIRNIGSGEYLETEEVFKDSDICNATTSEFKLLAEDTYLGETPFSWNTPRPLWSLASTGVGEWLVQPGSNEIKSTLSTAGDVLSDVVLVPRLADGEPTTSACPRVLKDMDAFDPERKFAWKFIDTGDDITLSSDNFLAEEANAVVGVYPNVIKGDKPLNVNLGEANTLSEVNIYNFSGKLIHTEVSKDQLLVIDRANISSSSGMYLVKIKTSSVEKNELIILK